MDCTRRSPGKTAEDPGSIPGTSTRWTARARGGRGPFRVPRALWGSRPTPRARGLRPLDPLRARLRHRPWVAPGCVGGLRFARRGYQSLAGVWASLRSPGAAARPSSSAPRRPRPAARRRRTPGRIPRCRPDPRPHPPFPRPFPVSRSPFFVPRPCTTALRPLVPSPISVLSRFAPVCAPSPVSLRSLPPSVPPRFVPSPSLSPSSPVSSPSAPRLRVPLPLSVRLFALLPSPGGGLGEEGAEVVGGEGGVEDVAGVHDGGEEVGLAGFEGHDLLLDGVFGD